MFIYIHHTTTIFSKGFTALGTLVSGQGVLPHQGPSATMSSIGTGKRLQSEKSPEKKKKKNDEEDDSTHVINSAIAACCYVSAKHPSDHNAQLNFLKEFVQRLG